MTREDSVLAATRELLACIANKDWATYERLCAADLTCFEPEADGHLVEGLEFHRTYFAGEAAPRPQTISSPHVRIVGDIAIVAYTRLTQALDGAGNHITRAVNETRVWRWTGAAWLHLHFHRSLA